MTFNDSNQSATLSSPTILQIAKFAYQTKKAKEEDKNWIVTTTASEKLTIRSWDSTGRGTCMDLLKQEDYRLDTESISKLEELSKDFFFLNQVGEFGDEELFEILDLDAQPDVSRETQFIRELLPLWADTTISETNFEEFLETMNAGFSAYNYLRFLDFSRLIEFYPRNEECPIFRSFCAKIVPLVKEQWHEDVALDFLSSTLRRNSSECFYFLSHILDNHTKDPEYPFQF
jgi:hypothetical protein